MELPACLLCALLHVYATLRTGWCQEECGAQVASSMEYAPLDSWVTLNCTYSCSTPVWTSDLQQRNQQAGEGWVSTEVLVDVWESSIIRCMQTLDNGEMQGSSVTVQAYAVPSKVTIDIEEEIPEGQRQDMTCTVFGVAPMRILKLVYMRGGRDIAYSTYEYDSREGPQTIAETFEFEANRRDNLQDFYCQAILELGTGEPQIVISDSITVRTYAPPDFPSIIVTPSTDVYEYNPLNLTCQSEGLPEPEFFWTIPSNAGVLFSPDKSQVIIAEATAAHSGTYECEARNPYGRTRHFKTINILPLPASSPDVPVILAMPGTTVREGQSLGLICNSNGYPEPEFFWTVPSGAQVTYSHDKIEIVISEVTSAHNGTYTCHARNSQGESKREEVIIVESNGVLSTRPTDILLLVSLLASILYF